MIANFVLTEFKFFIGKLVKVRRVVNRLDNGLIWRWSVANVLPVDIFQERVVLYVRQIAEPILSIATKSYLKFFFIKIKKILCLKDAMEK